MKNATSLKGRILWFDGDSSFEPDALYDYILSGNPLTGNEFVTEFTKDIRQFNSLNPSIRLDQKTSLNDFDKSWNIPEKYNELDITKYILSKLLDELQNNPEFGAEEIDERLNRVETELALFEKHDLTTVLKVVVYIVETFESNNVVWGTGRGSSCCSYCLYLIGLHDVDSVAYGLELSEFFRE